MVSFPIYLMLLRARQVVGISLWSTKSLGVLCQVDVTRVDLLLELSTPLLRFLDFGFIIQRGVIPSKRCSWPRGTIK